MYDHGSSFRQRQVSTTERVAAYAALPSALRVPKLSRLAMTAMRRARSASLLVGNGSVFAAQFTAANHVQGNLRAS